MKIAVNVKKFREEYYPDENRYEHTLVLDFLGKEIEVPCTEAELQAAVSEYQQLLNGHEDVFISGTESFGHKISGGPLYHPDGTEITEEELEEAYARTDFAFETNVLEEEAADLPQVFRGREAVLEHIHGMEEDLEEPLNADPMAMSLLGEAGDSLVDEITFGEPEDVPETGTEALFGVPSGPDPVEGPRRDMTPSHVKRKQAIQQRHQEGRAILTREEKLKKLRQKAKQIPIRKMSADEQGNPIVPATQQRRPQAHPANHDPSAPSVRRHQPRGPSVEDEDGFPSA